MLRVGQRHPAVPEKAGDGQRHVVAVAFAPVARDQRRRRYLPGRFDERFRVDGTEVVRLIPLHRFAVRVDRAGCHRLPAVPQLKQRRLVPLRVGGTLGRRVKVLPLAGADVLLGHEPVQVVRAWLARTAPHHTRKRQVERGNRHRL